MPIPTYERIPNNDADEDFVDVSAQPSMNRVRPDPELIVRPPVYYGEGPFDPPSSEDEDEDHFLHKSERRGVLDPDGFEDSEPGNGLRVGGGKVSTLCSVIPRLTSTSRLAPGCSEVSHILSGVLSIPVSLHWRPRCN